MKFNASSAVRNVLTKHGITVHNTLTRNTFHDNYSANGGRRHRVKVMICALPHRAAKRNKVEAEVQSLFGNKFVATKWSTGYLGLHQFTVNFDV